MKQLCLHLILCGSIFDLLMTACSSPASQPPTPTPMPSGMVDVGDSTYWSKVVSGVEGTTQICAYDRANLGRSEAAPKPRTFQEMTRDLHALLVNAQIEGPYILVGHSLGGSLVRVYADQYSEEVAGIVLVDAHYPDMGHPGQQRAS